MNKLVTAEFEPEINDFIVQFSENESLNYSQAMNAILRMGIKVYQKEFKPPTTFETLSTDKKIILKTSVENWLILKDLYTGENYKTEIEQEAKAIIKNTLDPDTGQD